MRLHITNGDIAAERIEATGIEGDVLPWRDVLHEGPVPAGLSLQELSGVRARWLAGCPGAPALDELLAEFARRDATLARFRSYEEVVLWFEHDLFDQLQILQVLHWLGRRERGGTRLSMICIDGHPGVERFVGLGQLSPEQLAELWPARADVTPGQLDLAARAWDAFCSEQPRRLVGLLDEDLDSLPFLRGALIRHLEQYPSTDDGLGRSERQLVRVLERGTVALVEAFRASQLEAEERPFMGDATFLLYVGALAGGRNALVDFEDGRPWTGDGVLSGDGLWERRLRLTPSGRRVAAGEADRLDLEAIDRWLGGVHLEGRTVSWRWSPRKRLLVERGGA